MRRAWTVVCGLALTLLCFACQGQGEPSSSLLASLGSGVPTPGSAFVVVDNRTGPMLNVFVNTKLAGSVPCGARVTFQVGIGGLPDLPWTVRLANQDGTSLHTTVLDAAQFERWIEVRGTDVIDSGEPFTGGPTSAPCPSGST